MSSAPSLRATAAGAAADADAPSSSAEAVGAGKRALIVGAGPCGSLTAHLLAKQGFTVDVFERDAPQVDEQGNVQVGTAAAACCAAVVGRARACPWLPSVGRARACPSSTGTRLSAGARSQASIGPRSYNILLNERAIQAMEQAGAQLEGYDVVELAASMRHAQKGGPAAGRSTRFPGRFKLASRGALAGALVQSCLAQHADRVTFHFGQARGGLGAGAAAPSTTETPRLAVGWLADAPTRRRPAPAARRS